MPADAPFYKNQWKYMIHIMSLKNY